MTRKNRETTAFFNWTSVLKRMIFGAGIALILILFFISGVESQPGWPESWRLRPLLLTPLAGAFGGALFYLLNHLLQQAGLKKIISTLLSILTFIVVLWLGVVLGLDGTLWD